MDTTIPRFQIAEVDGRLRFQSEEGWLELKADNGRALCMGGTFNDTVPEVFGGRIWHLLQTVMPELQIRVVQVTFPDTNTWLQRIFMSAGFHKDGTLRSWDQNFQDVAVYSILDSEARFEIIEPEKAEEPKELECPDPTPTPTLETSAA